MIADYQRRSGQTAKFEGKRETILSAAAALFNRKGVKATSLSEVAEAVGLATNSVTYYFRRKDDLAAACFMRSIAVYEDLIGGVEGEASPKARAAALLRAFFALLVEVAEGRHHEPVAFHDTRSLVGAQWEEVSQSYSVMFRRLRGLLADAFDDRSLLNARSHLFLSILHSMRLLAANYAPEDYSRVAGEVADIVLHGISAVAVPKVDGRDIGNAAAVIAGQFPDNADGFLRTATLLINEQGYRGASVEKISSHLNVTKGAFYHHNENKGDLVAECFERTFSIIAAVQRRAAGKDSGWSRLAFTVLVLARFQLSGSGPLLRRTALAALPEALRQEIQVKSSRITNRFTGFIIEGMRDGSLRLVDPMIAAHLINELVNAVSDLHYWARDIDEARIDEVFANALLTGGLFS